MTAAVAGVRQGPAGLAAVLAGAGVAALLARPWLAAITDHPTAVLIALFVALGAAGAWWPLPAAPTSFSSRTTAVAVLLAGAAAFAGGRLLAGGRAAAPALATYLVLNTLAAVAEEAFFRRLLYGLLAPLGAGVAIAGTAAAFAVVHLTVWGAWVLPLDLAAGLLLSWQRWASGRWTVPAVTHAAANVLAVL